MNLPINEIFSTVQGEGYYTGTPAVFVRLQYCPVGCLWCDTKHTWEKRPEFEIPFHQMLAKTEDAPTWADVNVGDLLQWLKQQPERLVVITGGEPCTYDLNELTAGILSLGKMVQIETSGTCLVQAHEGTFVTVSPKVGMPGGKELYQATIYRADEIKMPVGKVADVQALKDLLGKSLLELGTPIYLQPLSQSEKATALCIEAARTNGWRLSAQLHKYIGVR